MLLMAARHKEQAISSHDIDPVLAEYSGRCTKCSFGRSDKVSSIIHWNLSPYPSHLDKGSQLALILEPMCLTTNTEPSQHKWCNIQK